MAEGHDTSPLQATAGHRKKKQGNEKKRTTKEITREHFGKEEGEENYIQN